MSKNIAVEMFGKVASGLKPYGLSEDVVVKFNRNDSLIKEYVTELASTINLIDLGGMPQAYNSETLENDLNAYLLVILGLRVDYVNGQTVLVRPRDAQFAVPAFYSMLMEQIGVTPAPNRGFELRPETIPNYWSEALKLSGYQGEVTNDVCLKWFRAKTKLFRRLFQSASIEYSEVMPVSKEGEFCMMAMQMMKDGIYSIDDAAHPLFALCAAVLGLQQTLQTLWNTSVCYGNMNTMRRMLRDVSDLEVKGGTDR